MSEKPTGINADEVCRFAQDNRWLELSRRFHRYYAESLIGWLTPSGNRVWLYEFNGCSVYSSADGPEIRRVIGSTIQRIEDSWKKEPNAGVTG